jgi:hypothetical protein
MLFIKYRKDSSKESGNIHRWLTLILCLMLLAPRTVQSQNCTSYPFPFADKDIRISISNTTAVVNFYNPDDDIPDYFTFTWVDQSGSSFASSYSTYIYNVTSPRIYTVYATNGAGCNSASKTITVGQTPPPIPTFTINLSDGGIICADESKTITISNPRSGTQYTWTYNGTPLHPGEHSSQDLSFTYNTSASSITFYDLFTTLPSFSLGVTGQFYDAGSNSTVTASAATTIIVNTRNPIQVINLPTVISLGATLDLSDKASPAGGVWSGSLGGITGSIFRPLATQRGINALTYRYVQNGCTFATTKNITTTPPPPSVSAGPNQTVTFPVDPLTLTGSASNSYCNIVSTSWIQVSGPSTAATSGTSTANAVIRNLTFGQYVFQFAATDDCGGRATSNVTVTVNYPPNNYNYVRESSVLVSGKKQPNDLAGLTITEKSEITNYVDGLGRPMQTVTKQGSPNFEDLVEPVVYDDYDRQTRKYLPVSLSQNDGWFKPSIVDAQGNYTGAAANVYTNDGSGTIAQGTPYTETIFENSPLNRVIEQGSPGEAWQPGVGATIKMDYRSSQANEVISFKHDFNTGSLHWLNGNQPIYYEISELRVSSVTDEQGAEQITYTDKTGKMILKRVQYAGSGDAKQYADTYYVYDLLDNLIYVLPPEAVKHLLDSIPH